MAGNQRDPSAVLLVNDKYATSKDGGPTVNREVAQVLTGAGREVHSTVLEATEEDRRAAKADGVKLILPTRNNEDPREPCLAWLTFDHVTRYPSLPQDVGCIVGHADITSRAAAAIKEQRFPQASLGLVIETIPENTEKYKDEEKAMGIGEKEDSIVQDAAKADNVFSVGHHVYDHFQNSFRIISKDKKPTHYLFLPEPAKLFQQATVEYVESREKIVLFVGGVNKVEMLKGHDLAAKAMAVVVETSPDRIQYRVYGISKEEYQASMDILQASINSGKLIPTLLPVGTQEDICRHMQQAHLVIMPSRSEPFGLVGLQAMAAGVPVLISDQSGLATLVEKVTPEFYHSILEIEGDESAVVTRWAGQIKNVLKKSEVEFKRAAALKDKLLKSRYWEESHQCLLQACGGPAVREERTQHQSGDVPHVNPVPDLPVYLSLGMEQQQPAGMQQPPAGMQQRHGVLFWVFLLSLVFLLLWLLQLLTSLVQEPPWVLPWAVSWLLPLVFLLPWILPQPPRVQQPMTEVQYDDIYARIKEVERTMFTPEVLRDPALWVATCIRFLLHKAVLRGAVEGSVILLLRFLRQTDVDRFYHSHYRVGEGTLSQQLSHILISDELRDKVKGAQLIVRLHVKHEDYVRVRDRLGQGLKRTTSVDNLLTLPPPRREVDRSSLRGLDLAMATTEDQPCTDRTDDVSVLNVTARQMQEVVQTSKEKSQQQVRRVKAEMKKQLRTAREQIDAVVRSQTMEITRLREKEKAQKILLEQKEEIKNLSETKSMEVTIEELKEGKPTAKGYSQGKDPWKEKDPRRDLWKDPGKEEDFGRDPDNQTGVRKYFYYIKEKVSSDWKDLAFHLGFEQLDIDNIDGRNRDDKSHCMDLLEEWLKRNGERATIAALMEALSEANLQSVVDGLRKEFPEVLYPIPVPVGAAGTESSSMTEVFQKSIKEYYEVKLSQFNPLIWNDSFRLDLSDIFTQLELIQTQTGKQRTELKSLDDLFNPKDTGLTTAPRCILIEGEAGGGKTTFLSKEALDAISQKTELGRRHDIVLLIRLREVREGETIEEMVWDQCVPKTTEGIYVQSIRAILQRNESRVLFLLDGYDELRPEARAAGQAIPKLLSGRKYPNSTIVITSRPSAGVQQYTRPDCHVHIKGFSHRHVENYMLQYFTAVGKQELTNTLAEHVKDNNLLNTLIYTPIFLMLVCLLWEDDQEMMSTGAILMTGLYNNLLTCLVRKYCKREGVDMPIEGLPVEVAESLQQLGKLALEALLRNETLIDLTEVKRENVDWELLLKLGVVSLEVSSSRLHPRRQLNFSHKTMQEFLAGRYIAHALINQDIVELLQLTSISKVLELSNLLQFTCGCDSQAAQAVMEELCKLSSKEFSHLRPEDVKKSHIPMRLDVETYRKFGLLCFDILNESKEPGVLHAVSRALPVVIIDNITNSKQQAALKYYLENIPSLHLPDRMVLGITDCDTTEVLQYLEQTFTSPIQGLQLDLELRHVELKSPDETARLGSILKNVPCLKTLDLSCTNLTPSSLQPLVQGFSHMSLLEELDLSGNSDLGDAGMEVLQVGLSCVPHLAVLRLRHVGMTAVGMSSLAPYMRHLVGLRELDISGNKICDTGFESLTAVLPIFTAMQVLVLAGISISPTGIRTLAPALCQLTRLIKLDISHNAIGDPGLECLAAILHHLTAMKMLVLSGTGISDRGILALIKALPHLVQLQMLDVSLNNIGDSGIVSLVQTLCQPSHLGMEQNPPGDKSLTTAPHYNNTLQELDIGWNRGVTGAGLGRVAQLISALPALTRLDMTGYRDTPTHLPDTAAMALAEALPRLCALKWLHLWEISMEPAGFQAVMQAAGEHPTLATLSFSPQLVPEEVSCLTLLSE
ncbi:NLRP12 [Branchiostoma lanceolatum]|uniref:NLRP12 protein n=1 Tax=Branchiostoma lanceolatum TaxID=7740 RepID=A0A8J9ZDN8_BRALA|nr:NLRP12 [Branchiostoma lanceolatum]